MVVVVVVVVVVGSGSSSSSSSVIVVLLLIVVEAAAAAVVVVVVSSLLPSLSKYVARLYGGRCKAEFAEFCKFTLCSRKHWQLHILNLGCDRW